MFDSGLRIGDEITNDQVHKIFKCSTQGGMRQSNRLGVLVLISKHVNVTYQDKWENNILYYTGMGQEGNQQIERQNKTLYESRTNGVEVHLFTVERETVYTYKGIFELVKDPYQDVQLDRNGNERLVWIFPIQRVDQDIIVEENQIEDQSLLDGLDKVLESEVHFDYVYTPKPEKKSAPVFRNNIKIYPRNKATALRALAIAEFHCEVDAQHPTFIRKRMNKNYTEPHHLIPLEYSDEFDVSLDVEANIISLCSNCHNQLHYGRDYEIVLKPLYNERKEMLKLAGIDISYEWLKKMYE